MSNRVKGFHMAIGVDLIGSKTSMQESRSISLTATAIGIRMESKKTNRVVVVPYSNVKGFELHPDEPAKIEEPIIYPVPGSDAPKRRGRPPKAEE